MLTVALWRTPMIDEGSCQGNEALFDRAGTKGPALPIQVLGPFITTA